MMTRRQFVTAEKGRIVDISIPAIKIVMDLMNVKDQKRCLMSVVRCFHHFEAKRQENET